MSPSTGLPIASRLKDSLGSPRRVGLRQESGRPGPPPQTFVSGIEKAGHLFDCHLGRWGRHVPSRGLQYPGSYAEQRAWYPDDESRMDCPGWLRRPVGPVCPGCVRVARSVATGRVWRRGGCRKRVSRTAGTIFQDTRTPLTVWFAAAWYMCADPGGVSALTMQKLLGLGSYQTARRLAHSFAASAISV